MPRGNPDGKVQPFGFASQESDIGSVYQMLWGFSPIDSKGRVHYLDTYNNGLVGWQLLASGSGSLNPILVSSNPPPETIFSPPSSLKVQPGVTSGSRSLTGRRQFLGISPRLGLEAAILFDSNTPNYRLVMDYKTTTGKSYFALMRFDHATGSWQVYNSSSAYQTFFTPGVIGSGVSLWIQVKIVCNFSTGNYVRAMIGDSQYDLSAISMLTPGFYTDTYPGYQYMEVGAESYGVGSNPGYIGYVLATKDEP